MRILFSLITVLGLTWAQMDHSNMQMGGMGMTAMTELNKLSGRNYDIAYMSMMIEHHKGAVEMAQAALKASKDGRILKAARDIVAVQNREIAQLTGWLRSWYAVAPSQRYMTMMRSDMKPMMDTAMQGMTPMAGMAMPVDRSFLEGMIPHHQEAVEMSQGCLQKAARAELKTFCREVIRVQKAEIAQYQAWLKTIK
ncbi:MAG: DUF305 domain-containing protein [Meiothermus sp.]|nr:DUF305 domain-containing protein [Meiothermus sp.]